MSMFCVYAETIFCSTVSTQVACLFKARIIGWELTGAPSRLHLQWGGQRWKSTLGSDQTEYKCSCDPELTMCDWEVREQKSSGERFSSSVSLWITLMSNNFQPLSLHNSSRSASLWLILVKLRHVLLKMTLFERKRVLKAAELQRNILPPPPPRSSHIVTPVSILYERDVIKTMGSAVWYIMTERPGREHLLTGENANSDWSTSGGKVTLFETALMGRLH